MAEAVLEQPQVKEKKSHGFFSKPLFKQSLNANWTLWLVLALGSAAIFIIINLVVGTKSIFTNINMSKVSKYVEDENLSWLVIFGLFEQMGFSLQRLSAMSTLDLNSIMNDLIYKIAGVLLPMVYTMIVANKLVAAQVSDGSLAYVLSTPTNRKKVVNTQFIFLIGSLFAMYLVIFVGALVSGIIANMITNASSYSVVIAKTALYCLGSFLSIFALAGICFFASTFFNKSSNSIAVGGGACILAFLCCILGLFGNKVFVSVGVGVQAMNFFNYLSIFTLFDAESMSNCVNYCNGIVGYENSLNWIWELAILVVIGGVFSFIGAHHFIKKDLPL